MKKIIMFISGFGMSSVARKWIMGITGIFLCVFLLVHLSGNLILLSGDNARQTFNAYYEYMSNSMLVQFIRWVTYIGILFHIIYAFVLIIKNRSIKKTSYAYQSPDAKKKALNIKLRPILGAFILVFLVVHLKSFWFNASIIGLEDLYGEVVLAFQNIYYVSFYVFSMLFLAYHLVHGLKNGLRTLGLINEKYLKAIEIIALCFAIVVPALFSIIPIYIYILL